MEQFHRVDDGDLSAVRLGLGLRCIAHPTLPVTQWRRGGFDVVELALGQRRRHSGCSRLYVPAAPQQISLSGSGISVRPGICDSSLRGSDVTRLRVGKVTGVVIGRAGIDRMGGFRQAEFQQAPG